MDLGLENKKVLITGASRGIGHAIADSFLQEGSQTCIVSRGSKDLFLTEKKFRDSYGLEKSFAFKCDCTNLNSLKKLKEVIKKRWNSLDIAIVNVGDGKSVSDALPNHDQWNKIWKINFDSALLTARTFLPMLKKSKGCLLFISSIAGLEAIGAPSDYSTAKSAIIALAKNLARKLANENIRVNVIAPGNVYFKGGSWHQKIQKDKKNVDKMINSLVPMKRFASPKEIADPAIFLCSDKASFITGATLVIDGGQTIGVM